jgi:hypothetical protein
VQGPQGATGATGSEESALFYALMPSDNPLTVAIGADVQFPQNGPSTSTGIRRTGPDTFDLATPGVYRVSFTVPVTEAGQLELTLNGIPLDYTVTGRATGTSPISLTTLVNTTVANSLLTVRNSSSPTSLTITRLAGGIDPVSATLLIELVKAS